MKIKRITLFCIVFAIIFSFAACNPPKEESNVGLNEYLKIEKEPMPIDYVFYSTEKSRIAPDEDLFVNVYYKNNLDSGYSDSKRIISIEISYNETAGFPISNEEYLNATEILLTKIEMSEIDDFYVSRYVTVCEDVVLPSKVFVGKMGFVIFSVEIYLEYNDVTIYEAASSDIMYYKNEGETIKLSTELI